MESQSINKSSVKTRVMSFYETHEKKIDIGVFLGGFIFDIFTLGRIDDLFNILQQLSYLIILGFCITLEVKTEVLKQTLSGRFAKYWEYRRVLIHFLLGSLLSVYTLFFFKSGTLISSFVFIGLIVTLMVLNELPFIQNLGIFVRVVLFSLCLGSFFAILVSIIFGVVGFLPFTFALLIAAGIVYGLFRLLNKKRLLQEHLEPLKKSFLVPGLGTIMTFFLFYVMGFVPPVPISLEYIGIYHKVEKQNNQFVLYYSRPKWKFWQNGDQSFIAQPEDQIVAYVQVFSPTSFKDQVKLMWFYDEPKKGWHLWDSIPLTITGGRDTGFRGYGVKKNYQPGDWQVRVYSSDDREIGRISFTVETQTADEERVFHQDLFD